MRRSYADLLVFLSRDGISSSVGCVGAGIGDRPVGIPADTGLYFEGWYLPMGIAGASRPGMLLDVGDTMDCVTRGVVPVGDESVDDVFDMMIGGDGVASFLKKGWVLYCRERVS